MEAVRTAPSNSAGPPDLSIEIPSWQMDARCHDSDPAVFFGDTRHDLDAAARVCGGCRVREECLAYALETDAEVGVWGGLSARERRKLDASAA